MRKLRTFLFDFLFVLLTIAFLGAILSTIISPKLVWWLAFLGLGYPILLVCVALFLLYWLLMRNKKMIYPMILLLIGLVALPSAFNLKWKKKSASRSEKEIKVMSYNVRNFEVYDKKNGKKNRDAIIEFVKTEQPDVLCIQEALNRKTFVLLNEVAEQIEMPHYYFEVGVTAKSGGQFGVATFSKYPIKNTEGYSFGSGGNVGSKVTLDIDDQIVSVFNIHLESANIENSYYNYGSAKGKKISETPLIVRSKRVTMQLREAYQNRATQAETIHEEIKKNKNAVIVCGDFNDTPASYAFTKVKGGLKDTFKRGKLGFGETYPEIPILRIDHILVSNKFNVLDYSIKKKKISDHYPVVATVELVD